MLEYEKTDISESVDKNKSSKSGECSFCHFYYFIDKTLTIKNILRWLSRYVNESNDY